MFGYVRYFAYLCSVQLREHGWGETQEYNLRHALFLWTNYLLIFLTLWKQMLKILNALKITT